MKKLLLILLCLPMIGLGQVTMIPDTSFEKHLIYLGVDNILDGYVETNNIDTITKLNLTPNFNIPFTYSWIYNLQGIEDFLALEELNVTSNRIDSLDLSNNIFLRELICIGNEMSYLNVTNNSYLEYINCENNNLSSLNLYNLNNLWRLEASANQLTSLDIRNTSIVGPNGYSLQVYNPNLFCISCDDLSIVNGWHYWTSLSYDCSQETFGCTDSLNINYDTLATINDLTCNYGKTYMPDDVFESFFINNGWDNALDDSVLTVRLRWITGVNLYNPSGQNSVYDLTGIENMDSLRTLVVSYNQLSNINLSQNENLTYLNCSSNNIYSLDLTNNHKLEYLYFNNNMVSNINLSQNTDLRILRTNHNSLGTINLSNNLNLELLECNNNNISNLNLSNNVNLKTLNCSSNNISSLDLSNNVNLKTLNCSFNNLSSLDLRNGNNLSMHQDTTCFESDICFIYNPLLNCINVDDPIYSTTNWTNIDPQHYFSDNCSATSLEELTTNKKLLKVTDLLGRETKNLNQTLLYIYDDGSVEKKIIIE